MLRLRVLLKEPTGLCRQPVVEAWIRVHLHLQQHHRARARRRARMQGASELRDQLANGVEG